MPLCTCFSSLPLVCALKPPSWALDSKRKFSVPANIIESLFSSAKCFGTKFRTFASIIVRGKEFPVAFSSKEWFGTKFREFYFYFCSTVQNSSIFLFRGKVRNGIQRVSPSFVPRYKFREFSVLRSSLNSIGTTDLFRQLRLPRNYFCRKFPIKLIWTIKHCNSPSSKCCIKTIYSTTLRIFKM